MIGKISVKDIAGHVNLPLPTVFVMQRSAACIGFLDVPSFASAVALTVVNASGTSGTFPASKVDGIWSVNLPGSFFVSPGKVENGVVLKAYDSDQTEYLIGRGDLVIESADATPSPGETVTNITDKTLEGETFDLETGDGQYGAIKQLITKLGGTVAALAVMVAAHAAPPPGYTNDTYSADGVTWTRHGSINTRSSYVVTDATIPTDTGLTTNDVCNIVTNTVATAGEWRISGAPMPPNAMIQWTEYDATGNPYTQQTGWALPYTEGWFLIFGVSHERLDVFSYDLGTDPDALDLEMSSGDTGYSVTASRAERRNAFGFVTAADLPDVKPAAQLLLKGEDGNVYVVKVDSDGVLRYYRQEGN